MVDEVGDQHVTFAVHRQVTRRHDVVESSQLDIDDVYATSVTTPTHSDQQIGGTPTETVHKFVVS